MWIKICGITSREDAELAVAAGADAVGFVFVESPRRVTPDAVRKIVEKLPRSLEKIGVFVDATPQEMLSAMQAAGLTGVQLHGDCRAGLVQELRDRADKISGPLHVVRVLHYQGNAERFRLDLREVSANATADTIMVDTRIAGKHGGTGVPFDWLAARDSFRRQAPHLRLIAAGGLNPENVWRAIHTLRPWGVDVSSGVETAPGRKDRRRVVEFIRAARAAEMEFDPESASAQKGKC